MMKSIKRNLIFNQGNNAAGANLATVNVWNVGHGEAIRIDFNQRSVIRDFGRSITAEPKHPSQASTATNEQQVVQHPVLRPCIVHDAVLSHAHEDHLTGFEALYGPNVFDKAYIPWLDFKTLASLGGTLTLLATYMYAYSIPGNKPGRSARHWLRAAPLLAGMSQSLLGVKAGDTIAHWPVTGEVLWPPGPGGPGVPTSELSSALDRVRGLSPQNNDRIEHVAANVFRTLHPFYPVEGSVGSSGAEDALGSIDSYLGTLDDLRGSVREPVFQHCWMRYKDYVDDHSIVLRVGDCLFLSDLNEPFIAQMCQHHHGPARQYRVVKSSHHGTRYHDALAARVTGNPIILHCCGRAHKSYKGPDQRHDALAPARTLCTDWWQGGPKWMAKPAPYTLFAAKHQVV